MSWVGVAVGVGTAVVGGVAGADASRSASNKQADAARDAQRMQMQQYQQTRGDLMPWQQSGQMALSGLNKWAGLGGPGGFNPNAPGMRPFNMADFQQSPSYQFNLQQGQQAIDKASNARGNLYAPQTLQDISKFSQGLAGNEFNNAYNMYNQNQSNVWNRLFAQSGAGQNAAAGIGGFGASAAGRAGEYGTQVGNAQAAGVMGQNDYLQQGLGMGYRAYVAGQQPTYQQQYDPGAGQGNPTGYGFG